MDWAETAVFDVGRLGSGGQVRSGCQRCFDPRNPGDGLRPERKGWRHFPPAGTETSALVKVTSSASQTGANGSGSFNLINVLCGFTHGPESFSHLALFLLWLACWGRVAALSAPGRTVGWVRGCSRPGPFDQNTRIEKN